MDPPSFSRFSWFEFVVRLVIQPIVVIKCYGNMSPFDRYFTFDRIDFTSNLNWQIVV